MPATGHLQRRRQVWFVRLTVPPELRAAVGRRELIRTLGTRDISEANRRKHAVLAELQRALDLAAGNGEPPKDSPEFIRWAAKQARAAMLAGNLDKDTAAEELERTRDNWLEHLGRVHGLDPETGHPNVPDTFAEASRRARLDAKPLSEAIEKYLAEVKNFVRNQTHHDKRRHLREFTDWLGADLEPKEITKAIAGRYVTEKLLKRDVAPRTVKARLSSLSSLWQWLDGRGMVDANPWERMGRTIKQSTRGTAPTRRPWTDAELLKLLQAISKDDPLYPLTAIAAYTGARREEVALLRIEDIEGGMFKIREGKTAAAVRTVPIHPVLRVLIGRLAETTTDGYLIPGALEGGDDAKRAHYLGKRFSYLIRSIGFNDPALVFQTLRSAFIQRCEEAGIPESTAKLLVGHSRQGSLTYSDAGSGYSPGVSVKVLREAIAKVTYGATDGYIRDTAADVRVTKQSRRRPRAVYNRTQREKAA